jgi:hypothetical protein
MIKGFGVWLRRMLFSNPTFFHSDLIAVSIAGTVLVGWSDIQISYTPGFIFSIEILFI